MKSHINVLNSFENKLTKLAEDGALSNAVKSEKQDERDAAKRLGRTVGGALVSATQSARGLAEGGDTFVHRGARALLGQNKKTFRSKLPVVGKAWDKARQRRKGEALGKTLGGLSADAGTVYEKYKGKDAADKTKA